MKNSKLIYFINNMKISDLKGFLKFLSSSFSEAGETGVKVFKVLKKNHLKFQGPKAEKERFFKQIWPNESFKASRLANINTKLLRDLERYFSIKSLLNNEVDMRFFLAKSRIILQDEKLFLNNAHKLEKAIKKQEDSSEKYYQQAQFNELNLSFNLTDNYRPNNEYFLAAKENFDLFYYSYQLKICCEEFSHEKMFNLKVNDKKKVALLLSKTEQFHTEKHPLLYIYRCFLLFLYNQPQGYQNRIVFQKIIDLLKKHTAYIQNKELNDLFKALGKFCIHQRRQSNDDYLSLHFDLCRWSEKKGIILDDQNMSSSSFINVVFAAIAAREMNFAVGFIKKYRFKIAKKEQYPAVLMTIAQYRFKTGDYQKAIELLNKILLGFERYRLRRQYMLIRIYYEQFETNPQYFQYDLESKIASCRQFFINDRKINDVRRQQFLILIHFIRRMKTAHLNPNKTIRKKLLNTLKSEDVVYRSWLIKKTHLLP